MSEYFSEEGIKKLKDELIYLKTTKTKEIADLLRYAASFGDLKENAGYDDAKDRQAFLVRKIKELEDTVNTALVYEKKDSDKVQVGSQIVIILDEIEERLSIVAPSVSDILKGKLSYESPLGKKLLGRKKGDEFEFSIDGKKTKVKITEVF